MQNNILWTGREYYSLENCLVNATDEGTTITSTIIGLYQEKIYQAEYHIRVNNKWETISATISCRHNDHIQLIQLEADGKGSWSQDGRPAPQFDQCTDIDIPLTPFTNTLPINRLQLPENKEQEIRVIYIDLLEQQISAVRQKYIRLSAGTYHYENIPNDFEAVIKVDDLGLVVDYPQLFVRTAAGKSNYDLRK